MRVGGGFENEGEARISERHAPLNEKGGGCKEKF
jgi:hypothetical protein